ncbi:MAG TPA: DUF5670 family protein [bacterium]|nr:DUF5670 family protein [bacterium]
MFVTLAILLLLLWIFAVLTSNTLGGMIHLALGLAAVLVVWRLVHIHRGGLPA